MSISPSLTCAFWPQPATSSRWRCSSPAKTGASAIRSSIVRTRALLAVTDGSRLLGDVDSHRAPSDASSAADAAGRAELVPPAGELVGHPLPVSRSGRAAHGAAVDVGVVHGEARVPALMALHVLPVEVGHVLDGGAEAGWADHRAVPAGEAAVCDRVPARMLVVAV